MFITMIKLLIRFPYLFRSPVTLNIKYMMGLVDSVSDWERERLLKALSELKRGPDLDCCQLGCKKP